MAEDTAGGSNTASPAKSGWVSFDEDAADGGGRVNGDASATAKGSSPSSPSTGPTSSGVSSARGSVNSISRSNYDPSSPGALQVSEIQVMASVLELSVEHRTHLLDLRRHLETYKNATEMICGAVPPFADNYVFHRKVARTRPF